MRIGRLAVGVAAAALIAAPVAIAGSPQKHVEYVYIKGAATSTHTAVWLGRSGSRPRRLAAGDLPLVSPNGRLVAISQILSSASALSVRSVTGGASHAFFQSSKQTAWPLAWSPDSRYIAVELFGTSVDSAAGSALAVIDTSTMTTTTIAKGFVSNASFAPTGVGTVPDELVYAITKSQAEGARSNLFTAAPDGAAIAQLTTNGRSLEPVWGRRGILFDHERLRGRDAFPEYQIWLLHGSRLTQLTHLKVSTLTAGPVPLGVDANGNRAIVEFEGQDTSYAWRLQISPLRVSQVKLHGEQVQGAAISRNGARLLVDQGAFMDPPNDGRVYSMPFAGGRARLLAHGADPSWDG